MDEQENTIETVANDETSSEDSSNIIGKIVGTLVTATIGGGAVILWNKVRAKRAAKKALPPPTTE
jgi:hypothetical protein